MTRLTSICCWGLTIGLGAEAAFAQLCPLAGPVDPGLCKHLQATDCITAEPDKSCWPDSVLILPPPGQGAMQVAGCGCYTANECGPVQIGDATLGCAPSSCPNLDPLTDCFVHVNGQSTGLFSVTFTDLQPGDVVSCQCSFPPIVACCLLTFDVTCQQTTPAGCLALGGTPLDPGTTCLGHEACCIPGGIAGGECLFIDRVCCEELGATPLGPGSTCTGIGGCCYDIDDGPLALDFCVEQDQACCQAQGGVPQDPGTTCTTASCCLPGGLCQDADPECCIASGGSPGGPGSACALIECPPVIDGACCYSDGGSGIPGSCQVLSAANCAGLGGQFEGPGTTCGGSGACCFGITGGGCAVVDEICCDNILGTFQGVNTPCLGDDNGNGLDDACEPPRPCPGGSLAECADLDGNGVRDDNCVWWACTGGTCQATGIVFADMGGMFGACPPDGAADGNDRVHALNCFADTDTSGAPGYPCEASPPQAFNVDAGGPFGDCNPDGVCDGHDAFHALNAFDGSSACTCPPAAPSPALPAPPRPHPPAAADAAQRAAGPAKAVPAAGDSAQKEPQDTAPAAPSATIALRARSANIQPGRRVEVEVTLQTALSDLRGYQLHLAARGGSSGSLQLVDIAIERRSDLAFAGLPFWSAFNASTGQMLAGLDSPGVAVPAGAYLATFTYQASPDAAGEFAVELLADRTDSTQRTFLFPTPAGSTITIPAVPPARIAIGAVRARETR
jgi:hypothetical protein